jgi:hypothetical protein
MDEQLHLLKMENGTDDTPVEVFVRGNLQKRSARVALDGAIEPMRPGWLLENFRTDWLSSEFLRTIVA